MSMMKIKSVLNPEVAKVITDHYPIAKKRTALWFFTDEYNKKWKQAAASSDCNSSSPQHTNHERKPKRADVWEKWKTMNPESKRKYFNMAELDEVRYKEQKSLWVAEIGSLIVKHGHELNKITKFVSNQSEAQDDALELDKYQKNFDCMIQTQSTRMLYKDIIEKTKNLTLNPCAENLISAVPQDFRPILNRPRRPAPPFILYTNDNKAKLMRLRSEKYPKITFLKSAAISWAKESRKKRMIYEDKYNKLMEEYNAAMQKFKSEMLDSEDKYLVQAYKEKKAFRKSLRRRLREFAVVPLNVRNAFNFFLMDNKDISLTELTEKWRQLPEEEKEKYKQLNQQDMIRYQNEKSAYDGILKSLEQVGKKRTRTSSCDDK